MEPKRKLLPLVVVALIVVGLALFAMSCAGPSPLGVTDGRLLPCPDSPNCVSSQADLASPQYVEPLDYADTPADEAWSKLIEGLASRPQVRLVTVTSDYVHAEFTSLVFRFKDDIEFTLDTDAHCIHVRSLSRVGRSDFGVNRERVESLRAELQLKK